MKALILAGGFGTRLKELGENTPKGLLKQGDTPLMTHICKELESIEAIDEVALVTNNKYFQQYNSWLSDNFPKIKIFNDGINTSEERLGALGDLQFVVEKLSWANQTVIVLPSDTYFEFSLNTLVSEALQNNDFTTVVRDVKDPGIIAHRLGCAVIKDNLIVDFIEKPANPPSTLASIPFYIYRPKDFILLQDYQRAQNNMDTPGSFIPWLLKKGEVVRPFVVESNTLDVGTKVDFEMLQNL